MSFLVSDFLYSCSASNSALLVNGRSLSLHIFESSSAARAEHKVANSESRIPGCLKRRQFHLGSILRNTLGSHFEGFEYYRSVPLDRFHISDAKNNK